MLRMRDALADGVNDSRFLKLTTATSLVEILVTDDDSKRFALLRETLETDLVWRRWCSQVLRRSHPESEHAVTDDFVRLVERNLVQVLLVRRLPFCEFVDVVEDGGVTNDCASRCCENSDHNATMESIERKLPTIIGALAESHRLRAEFNERLEQEKLAAMVQLAYGAGHEINNPLANIASRAQTLLREEKDPDRRHRLATINSQVFRAHEMIADMMLFAKPPMPTVANVDLVALVETVAKELSAIATSQQSSIVLSLPSRPLRAFVDETQIGVALKALCVNSLHALGRGGTLTVALRRCDESKFEFSEETNGTTQWVELSVSDDGPGISPDVRKHIFDPFYSGREAGRGLGFGLSKCWRIVKLHHGTIRVESNVGVMTRFTIELPIRPS